jgi:hypothetical protein
VNSCAHKKITVGRILLISKDCFVEAKMSDLKSKEAGYAYANLKPDDKVHLMQPPAVTVQGAPPAMQPPDYFVMSIFNILCCFWPLGIVALLKSLEVRSHYTAGRYHESVEASKAAKLFNQLGFGIGCAIFAFSMVITLITVVVSVAVPLALYHNNITGKYH